MLKRLVSLEKEDYEIIDGQRRKLGLGGKGFSAALRAIIREWSDCSGQRVRITPAGKQVLDDARTNGSGGDQPTDSQ